MATGHEAMLQVVHRGKDFQAHQSLLPTGSSDVTMGRASFGVIYLPEFFDRSLYLLVFGA
jgi:hypothetical protein